MTIRIRAMKRRAAKISPALNLVAHSTEVFDIGNKAIIELYGATSTEADEAKTRLFLHLEGTPRELRKLCRSLLIDLRKQK